MKEKVLQFEDKKERRPPISRAQRRAMLRSKLLLKDLLSIIHSYFPGLIFQLKNVEDPRHKSYTTFDIEIFLLERILAAIFSVDSMRSQTFDFNDETAINNIAEILRKDNLDELPCHDTINNCFKKLKPSELEQIIRSMIVALTRRNTFNDSRIRGKYWQVLIDGTTLSSFNKKHCDKCLFRRHKNKKGEVTYIEFYHNVLEAKLVLHENLVFSICTVFIENENGIPSEEELFSPDYDEPSNEKMKQDCELKAFYRLSTKLKDMFPRLPICITADGLYPCKQVFEICRENSWRYILRFKEGCIPTLYDSYNRLRTDCPPEHSFSITVDKKRLNYFYATGLIYDDFTINLVECKDSSVEYAFLFITDLPVDRSNCESTVIYGRRRWRIENEGFKVQKKHGYYLKHMFSENYNAIKIHYYLIQIAHTICQLLEYGCDAMKILKLGKKQFHKALYECFKSFILTPVDLLDAEKPRKIRLMI